MGRGKFKGKPTGRRNFSTPEEIASGTSGRPRSFKKNVAEAEEEIEKQKSHERYMKLQEQGKTEQAKKDLERLALIRQQRADAAKKREEEKAAKEQRKTEARK
ncbi:unnamed protein product [Triticum turgidum subsp. durum]|uniref:Casein kinase substrate phosphoprotein PP28 domain-containing protein n=1 Tax=Triticum turgidum subsp. durum TaxID=4567 RepID=A0A9R0RPV9_TRITD|nr:unnamed protein product [Triticum turgidum subsp. durum]